MADGGPRVGVAGRQVLAGRYEIEEELGRGGMARVFRARDAVLGRIVAVKILPEWLASDPRYVERFRREAQAAARLSHPGVVNVYDTGEDGGVHFIVMEYVQGRELSEMLAAQGAIEPEQVARIGSQVADALAAAHAVGLVHRDVKPANIMLTRTGDAKVMDFGIARDFAGGSLTQTGTVFGTATYLSPEQARGEVVDGRSDLYSLGVVLHEALTGKPPFTGENAMAVAHKHLEEAPTPPSEVNPRVPEGLDRVVLHALEKDREDRYATAEELRDDLDRFRKGEPVLAGAAAAAGVAATAPVDLDRTSVLPAAGTTAPPETHEGWAPPRRRGPDRRTLVAAAVVGALLLLGAVVAVALSGGSVDPAELRREARQDRAQETTPAETTPPPSETTAAPVDPVAAAAFGLEDALQQGLANGEIEQEAAAKIWDEAEKALAEAGRGDVDRAVERLEHLDQSIWDLYEEGHITSEERATILSDAVTSLRDAVAALPHDDEGDEGDEGKGKAKGHDKQDEDDD